jgi:putative Mn2+ efflux pump MntP
LNTGLSFAYLKVNIALARPISGIVAMVVTHVGFIIDKKASKLIGKRAELIGGLIHLAIAIISGSLALICFLELLLFIE